MTDLVRSSLVPTTTVPDWTCAEMELDQQDLDVIVAALWVARRDLSTWSDYRDSRVERLRRFFNAPNARYGEVTLYATPDLAPPPEST